MSRVRVLVLRAAGINCDEEVVHCWRLAGAEADLLHLHRLVRDPRVLDGYRIVILPGGFSYGDDIAAGRILALHLSRIDDHLHRLVEGGGGILGICNGFQVLIRMGLLPGGDLSGRVTLTHNDSARFEARWVRLKVCTARCPFLVPDARIELPVEHAEVKLVTDGDDVAERLAAQSQIAVRYVDAEGREAGYPANPNGSVRGIAGLCDPTGRILGLMPHPDRHFTRQHHPCWTSRPLDREPDGLTMFRNAVRYWSKR
ncbi:MAG: phosphoribosylformylglycinamidine synthase I [Planctomycetota bacterium]|nr:MAG: phosphoribosylformylglycinamidine synthase I [Planctomycetota bacterium]